MEKEIFPLLEFDIDSIWKVPEEEEQRFLKMLNDLIEKGYAQPNELIAKFKSFEFLFDRNTSTLTKKLFGNKHIQNVELE